MLPTEKSKPKNDITTSKICILGRPGTGKSTLASQLSKKVLFADLDNGTQYLSVYRNPSALNTWSDLEKYVDAFIASDFTALAIDTAKKYLDMAEVEICARYKVKLIKDVGYGGGYTETKKLFMSLLEKIVRNGKGVILITHDKLKEYTSADGVAYTSTGIDLPKSYENEVVGFCDFVFFTYRNSKKELVLKTKADAKVEGLKDRSNSLPDKIMLDGDSAAKLITSAVAGTTPIVINTAVGESAASVAEKVSAKLADVKLTTHQTVNPGVKNYAPQTQAQALGAKQ